MYKLVIDSRKKSDKEKRFIVILENTLEELDEFTSSFKNEHELKQCLVDKRLLKFNLSHYKLRIVNKDNEIVKSGVIYNYNINNIIPIREFMNSNIDNKKIIRNFYYTFRNYFEKDKYNLIYFYQLRDYCLNNYYDYLDQEVSINECINYLLTSLFYNNSLLKHKLIMFYNKYNTSKEIINDEIINNNLLRYNHINELLNRDDISYEERRTLEKELYNLIVDLELEVELEENEITRH